ncbi:MAG: hypothetical protein ACJ789_21420 [Thermomicrobiales bacterium]
MAIVSILTVLLGMLVPLSAAMASPATPVPPALPASACQVAPQTVAALNEIVSTTGTPTLPITSADAAPYVKPAGALADAETVDGITFTVQQFVACGREGDVLRLLALFTDDFLRTNAQSIGLPITADTSLLTPMPTAETLVSIKSIDDVIETNDGKVSALVTFHIVEGYKSEDASLHIVFVKNPDDGRWLIDTITVVNGSDTATGWIPVQGEGYEGVIVPQERVEELTDVYVGKPIEGAWSPTAEDIAALEQSLPSYEQTIEGSTPGLSGDFIFRLPSYKRQYAGFILGGRKLILVNATCKGDDLSWRARPLIVMDGGDCFFRVTYDPAAGTYADFEINGTA